MKPILQLQRLNVALPPGADRTHAIRDLDLSLSPNEILCVVGESGSGKSMTAGAIMGLLPSGVRADSGSVLFDGQDLLALSEADMRKVRGAKIAMVFQEPMTALNPLRTVGDQIGEMFRVHTTLDAREIQARVIALLTDEGHDLRRAHRHVHRRRIDSTRLVTDLGEPGLRQFDGQWQSDVSQPDYAGSCTTGLDPLQKRSGDG